MTTRAEAAKELFNGGFNCAQSVVGLFSEKYGLSQTDAFKIAGGLGGGVRSGEICGAILGAVMVVGLKYGQYVAGDIDAKLNCNEKTIEFMNAFRVKHNAVTCRDLMGCDTSTPEGKEYALQHNLHNTVCADLKLSAVEILEELGY